MSYLPKDITDLISEKLGRGPRNENLPTLLACSTAHSSFTDECQKYIFQAVTLLAATAIYTATDPFYGRYKSTIRFAEVLNGKPHLRRYVKDVTYQISEDVYSTHRDSLLQALENLHDLEALQLEGVVNPIHRRYATRFNNLDRETKEGMISIAKHNSLKLLSLCCVNGVPPELIEGGECLEVLKVTKSQLQDTDLNDQQLRNPLRLGNRDPSKQTSPNEQLLLALLVTAQYLTSQYLKSRRVGTPLFTHLIHLDLGVYRADYYLLAEAQCLESLYLEIDTCEPIGVIQSPLGSLNPASYQTLSHLTYSIVCLLDEPGLTITNPYYALLDAPLSNFVALQFLQINLIYQGNFGINWDLSFGRSWGRLCEVLDVHTAPPKLKKVAVVVHLRTRVGKGWNWDKANKFLDHLRARVYPAQFHALDRERCDEKSIDFSFEFGLSLGQPIRSGRGREFVEEQGSGSTV